MDSSREQARADANETGQASAMSPPTAAAVGEDVSAGPAAAVGAPPHGEPDAESRAPEPEAAAAAPSPPPGLIAVSVLLGTVLLLASLIGVTARIGISIRDHCFFSFGPTDFDEFRRTGSVCDANFGVNFVIGSLLSIEGQIDMALGVSGLMKNRVFILGSFGLLGCWQVARLAAMATFIALGLPFAAYCVPAIVVFVVGFVQAALLVASLPYFPVTEGPVGPTPAPYDPRLASADAGG